MKRKNNAGIRPFTTKLSEHLFVKHLASFTSRTTVSLFTTAIKTSTSKVARACLIVVFFCGVSIWTSEVSIKTAKNLASNLFGNAESIAIGSAAVVFFLEIPDRKKRDQYEAWQVINSGLGQTGSGGRIQALEDLKRDGVDLEGIAVPKAELSGINLSGGKLNRANFREAQLDSSNLSRADLIDADLNGANLYDADLSDANLSGANLSGADLRDAKLRFADLIEADLRFADLSFANLSGANLSFANMGGANLSFAELSFAKLRFANLSGANLSDANLNEADLFGANLSGADLRGAILRVADPIRDSLMILSNADLSGATVTNTRFSVDVDLSNQAKQDLIARGAIFDDRIGN